MRAEALAAVEIWSFQERSDPRVTPSIEMLSLNSNELESNDMSGRFLLTRLEIRQHWVFTALKLTKFLDPKSLSLHRSKLIEEAMSIRSLWDAGGLFNPYLAHLKIIPLKKDIYIFNYICFCSIIIKIQSNF